MTQLCACSRLCSDAALRSGRGTVRQFSVLLHVGLVEGRGAWKQLGAEVPALSWRSRQLPLVLRGASELETSQLLEGSGFRISAWAWKSKHTQAQCLKLQGEGPLQTAWRALLDFSTLALSGFLSLLPSPYILTLLLAPYLLAPLPLQPLPSNVKILSQESSGILDQNWKVLICYAQDCPCCAQDCPCCTRCPGIFPSCWGFLTRPLALFLDEKGHRKG